MSMFATVLGFLMGSIPFGYVLVRLTGRGDIREVGSGNIGATNVGRVLGPVGWTLTLVGDAGKGTAAVAGAAWLAPADPWAMAGAGFGAILGHCYTPWLGGRGGKGVATMLGVFGFLAPRAILMAIACFLVVAGLTRYASAASVTASAALVLATWLTAAPVATILAAAGTALVIVLRHRDNLGRLMRGTEARMGGSSP